MVTLGPWDNRDQDADRLYDEDEILYYEVSGCSQQVPAPSTSATKPLPSC